MKDFITLLITAVSIVVVLLAVIVTLPPSKNSKEGILLDSSWKCTKYYSNFQLIGKIIFYNDYCVQYSKEQ